MVSVQFPGSYENAKSFSLSNTIDFIHLFLELILQDSSHDHKSDELLFNEEAVFHQWASVNNLRIKECLPFCFSPEIKKLIGCLLCVRSITNDMSLTASPLAAHLAAHWEPWYSCCPISQMHREADSVTESHTANAEQRENRSRKPWTPTLRLLSLCPLPPLLTFWRQHSFLPHVLSLSLVTFPSTRSMHNILSLGDFSISSSV